MPARFSIYSVMLVFILNIYAKFLLYSIFVCEIHTYEDYLFISKLLCIIKNSNLQLQSTNNLQRFIPECEDFDD